MKGWHRIDSVTEEQFKHLHGYGVLSFDHPGHFWIYPEWKIGNRVALNDIYGRDIMVCRVIEILHYLETEPKKKVWSRLTVALMR
jgi:hypothetical protein